MFKVTRIGKEFLITPHCLECQKKKEEELRDGDKIFGLKTKMRIVLRMLRHHNDEELLGAIKLLEEISKNGNQ